MKEQSIIVQSALAAHVKDKKDHFEKLFDRVVDYRLSREYEDKKKEAARVKAEVSTEEEPLTGDPATDKLIRVAREMKRTGEWEKMNADLQAVIKEHKKHKAEASLKNADGTPLSIGMAPKE